MTKRGEAPTFAQKFNADIERINERIEVYRELIPKAKPLILQYKEFFKDCSVSDTIITLTPKDPNALPPQLFCDAIEMGMIAKVATHSGMHHYSTSIEIVLNKC